MRDKLQTYEEIFTDQICEWLVSRIYKDPQIVKKKNSVRKWVKDMNRSFNTQAKHMASIRKDGQYHLPLGK